MFGKQQHTTSTKVGRGAGGRALLVGLVIVTAIGAGLAVSWAAGNPPFGGGAGWCGGPAYRWGHGGMMGFGAAGPGMSGPWGSPGGWGRGRGSGAAALPWAGRFTTEEIQQRLDYVTRRLATLSDPKTAAAFRQIHPDWTDDQVQQWMQALTQRLASAQQWLQQALAAQQGQGQAQTPPAPGQPAA